MYVVPPHRGPDPSEATGAPRVYQAWKGSNVFLFKGRFIFGPDARSLFLTIFLIAAPVIVFCVFVARKLMNDFSHHLGISIMVVAVVFTIYDLTLLLLTSGRDPGIIPRNAHPPEPEGIDGTTDIGGVQTPQMRLPRTKDVIVNGITVKIKYCDTCMLYRPPRCSHCSICNNCVEHFDHHCPWVGQCIGLRNYRFFYMFVFSSTLLCIFVFAFCWVYIKKIMGAEHISLWKAMAKTPASIVLIVYTFISMWFVGGLSVFHLYLMSTNQTTYENFRYRYDRRANPYNRGVFENFKEIFFTRIPPSKNNFRAMVEVDQGVQARSSGGGFISPSMGKVVRDIEMGRKPVAWDDSGEGEIEVGMSNEMSSNKDYGSNDASTEVNPGYHSEGVEGRVAGNGSRSSWGRRSGSWEMPSEVLSLASEAGDSNRVSRDDLVASNR